MKKKRVETFRNIRYPVGRTIYIPYSGYFSRGNIFVVFVVERRTTKYLPTKKRESKRDHASVIMLLRARCLRCERASISHGVLHTWSGSASRGVIWPYFATLREMGVVLTQTARHEIFSTK